MDKPKGKWRKLVLYSPSQIPKISLVTLTVRAVPANALRTNTTKLSKEYIHPFIALVQLFTNAIFVQKQFAICAIMIISNVILNNNHNYRRNNILLNFFVKHIQIYPFEYVFEKLCITVIFEIYILFILLFNGTITH